MSKADEIFRTYFSIERDLENFKLKHFVSSFADDSWGEGSCELHVANEDRQRMVYDDKPSRIWITPHGEWYATVAWECPGGVYRRECGPAIVCVDEMGGTLELLYRDGVEIDAERKKVRKSKAGRYFFRGVLIE